ncbi:sulfatase [Planctomycetota bacterium]
MKYIALIVVMGITLIGNFRNATAAPVEKPNFVIVFTDDQGYQDVGCFGSPKIKTPELDRMAREGCRFTSFYVAAHVCSPSRGALLTGRHPGRIPINGVYFPRNDKGMPLSEITLADVLKKQGYATSCVGKWHLGHTQEYLPAKRGFDTYFGIPYSNDMAQDGRAPLARNAKFYAGMKLENYREYQPKNGTDDKVLYKKYKSKVPLISGTDVIEWPVDQTQLTRRYTEEAVQFIKSHQDQPFFLYLAHSMPHIPLFASDGFKGKSARGLYGDVIEEIDWSVGRVLQTLRDLKLGKKTFVIFTSDNGPWLVMGENGGAAEPLRDGKGSTYEGGQRVPCIMWWPGQIQAGTENNEMASTMDMMPTLSWLAGTEPPADRVIDGHNIWPLMIGKAGAKTPYKAFVYYRGEAVRVGDWKYRKGKEYGTWLKKQKDKENPVVEQLFNLKDDIGEQENLIDQYPEKAAQLKAKLDAFRRQVQPKKKN